MNTPSTNPDVLTSEVKEYMKALVMNTPPTENVLTSESSDDGEVKDSVKVARENVNPATSTNPVVLTSELKDYVKAPVVNTPLTPAKKVLMSDSSDDGEVKGFCAGGP